MKRVLVVSPSFPPISAADLHRVRTSLRFYREFGWDPVVLAIRPEVHGGLIEPELTKTVPDDVPIEWVGALPAAVTRRLGVGNAGLRAWAHLYRAGARVIAKHSIDLAYFSTTMFPVMCLGRLWKARFGTPYVLDLQDAWRTDYRGQGAQTGIKASAARAMHGVLEPFAMRRVDGIVTVSPRYTEALQARYAWIGESMCTTIPFGVSTADFDAAAHLPWRNRFFDRHDGAWHGVAVGRGGADLSVAAQILFRAIARRSARTPALRLSFVGTDYASRQDHKTIEPIASASGAAGLVREWPERVPYLEGLRLLRDAHFTVILGSDDAAYSPSKVYPYLTAGRPFVAVLHQSSPVAELLRQAGTGVVVTFDRADDVADVAASLDAQLDRALARIDETLVPSPAVAQAISARELTRRQCLAIDAAVRHAAPQGIPCVE